MAEDRSLSTSHQRHFQDLCMCQQLLIHVSSLGQACRKLADEDDDKRYSQLQRFLMLQRDPWLNKWHFSSALFQLHVHAAEECHGVTFARCHTDSARLMPNCFSIEKLVLVFMLGFLWLLRLRPPNSPGRAFSPLPPPLTPGMQPGRRNLQVSVAHDLLHAICALE